MQMILYLLSAPALVLTVQAAPAASQQLANAAPAVPSEAQAEDKPDAKQEKPKRICRTIRNTGMRTNARQCKTQEQWERSGSEAATDQDLQMKTGQINPS
ncbi:MAG: hypothetical protein U0995_13430 [Erythrobacter sp.]|nr:hypothetical protein [Erythrobacter sp.]